MNIEYIDHIGVFKNVYPEGYCQHLISGFNILEQMGAGANRLKGEGAPRHVKDDYQIIIEMANHNMSLFEGKSPSAMFFDGLQKCYDEYTNKYSVLRDNGGIRATVMKMQRTGPGGGYHVWHCEQGPRGDSNRAIAYMLYLNSIAPEEGAETEFLYQKKRFNPTENTMVIWPAAYTHAHRGNPVLGETHKYIVTGWFYYD
jgi:hypothetical protein